MARVCEICGKGTISARSKKHNVRESGWKFRATSKPTKLAPNLRKVKLVDTEDNIESVKVCMKCYKKLKQA